MRDVTFLKDPKTTWPAMVVYRYTCCVEGCDSVHEEQQQAGIGYELPNIYCPSRWRHLFGALYCPKHKIELVLDGQTRCTID